jgi:hypothetical protein
MDFGFADTDSMMLVREQVNINEETIMSCGEWFQDSIVTIKATKGLIPMIWFNFVVQFSQYPGMVEATFFSFLSGKPNEEAVFIVVIGYVWFTFVTIGTVCGATFVLSNCNVIIFNMVRLIFPVIFLLVHY